MYGYQRVQYLDTKSDNPLLTNAPEHYASFKGVAPIVRDLPAVLSVEVQTL